MSATTRHINWSPLQVASYMLASNGIFHHIVGEGALLHYQATPTSNQEFSIEICVCGKEIPKAVHILKAGRLFQKIPDHITTQSCYEGAIAYGRLQAVWTVSQPRSILLLPFSDFFAIEGLGKVSKKLQHHETQLLGLSREDVARIPFADPDELFVALVNRSVDDHDQLAELTAKRLFDTGMVNESWLRGLRRTWNRNKYDLAMTIVGNAGDAGKPSPATSPPSVNNQDCNTAEEGGRGQKRKRVSKGSSVKRCGNPNIKSEP